jgi:hypothetical protein
MHAVVVVVSQSESDGDESDSADSLSPLTRPGNTYPFLAELLQAVAPRCSAAGVSGCGTRSHPNKAAAVCCSELEPTGEALLLLSFALFFLMSRLADVRDETAERLRVVLASQQATSGSKGGNLKAKAVR